MAGASHSEVGRRGAYFFVIDAFIAAIIVSGTIVVLFGSFTEEVNEREVFYAAEDLLVLLESTEIRDLESNMTRQWIFNGSINDSRLSVIQQIGLFNVTGRREHAENLSNISLRGMPVHVSGRILIDNDMYAEKITQQPADADVFFTSKRILLIRESQTDLYPPVIVEVQTWQ